jgi:nitrate reductase alpha subunit
MSMVSYAAGSRYLSLIGGVCMSFYDWYCDLPPASPQTWGEQTDVPESADWYNAGFIILWGSNVPQTRTPDAHFYTEARYRGMKSAVICPDYSEAAKFGDIWLSVKQGTDSALAMAMGHVILKEFHVDRQVPYFRDYVRRYTDMPMLVRLVRQGDQLVPERFLRASDFVAALGETNNPDWKTVAFDETTGDIVAPHGTVGFRWGETGKWNLEEKRGDGTPVTLCLSLDGIHDEIAEVAFPYFGNIEHAHFASTDHASVLNRRVPVKRLALAEGETLVASVHDLLLANYGVDRGYGGDNVARDHDDPAPYTPAWAEAITGVSRDKIIHVAREFASNAEKTGGRSMIIIGAAMNHWFHADMNYRGVINMLVMCGCVGQSGGGWAHYVGQEKLRPQAGWAPLAFALDWGRPPRQQNSTSAFYAHTDQWRYETMNVGDIVSPTAPPGPWDGTIIDYNIRAERMGWLPSAPQLQTNPLQVAKDAAAAGLPAKDYVVKGLKEGTLKLSCEDPDNPKNWPRNLFVWRSNLLGSSGKGHEYFLKHLLGTTHGVLGKGPRCRGPRQGDRGGLARARAGGKARPPGDARLPDVDDLRLLRHRSADSHLVREERPQYLRHAPLHPSADQRGGPGVGIAQRLGDLQGDRQGLLPCGARSAGCREGRGAQSDQARQCQ